MFFSYTWGGKFCGGSYNRTLKLTSSGTDKTIKSMEWKWGINKELSCKLEQPFIKVDKRMFFVQWIFFLEKFLSISLVNSILLVSTQGLLLANRHGSLELTIFGKSLSKYDNQLQSVRLGPGLKQPVLGIQFSAGIQAIPHKDLISATFSSPSEIGNHPVLQYPCRKSRDDQSSILLWFDQFSPMIRALYIFNADHPRPVLIRIHVFPHPHRLPPLWWRWILNPLEEDLRFLGHILTMIACLELIGNSCVNEVMLWLFSCNWGVST